MLEAEKSWASTESVRSEHPVRHNMAIESFLLHFRNLRDFLYPSKHAWTKEFYFDDVIANDFSCDWLGVEDDWKECSVAERDRINKKLSHLSYSRPELHKKAPEGWPISEMSRSIQRSFAQFIANLPAARKEWFRDIIVGNLETPSMTWITGKHAEGRDVRIECSARADHLFPSESLDYWSSQFRRFP